MCRFRRDDIIEVSTQVGIAARRINSVFARRIPARRRPLVFLPKLFLKSRRTFNGQCRNERRQTTRNYTVGRVRREPTHRPLETRIHRAQSYRTLRRTSETAGRRLSRSAENPYNNLYSRRTPCQWMCCCAPSVGDPLSWRHLLGRRTGRRWYCDGPVTRFSVYIRLTGVLGSARRRPVVIGGRGRGARWRGKHGQASGDATPGPYGG